MAGLHHRSLPASRPCGVARLVGSAAALLAMAMLAPPADAQRFDQPPWDQIDLRMRGLPPESMPTPPAETLASMAIDDDLMAAVQSLDSDDFATREQASARLREDEPHRMQIYALLARDVLSAEQRYRLLQVVREQLVNMPRGAIGIEMDQPRMWGGRAAGPLEIKINNVLAGFPAERFLQVGDRILAIDGRPLFVQDDLRDLVQAKKPGETVAISVRRARTDDNGAPVRDANGQPVTDVLTLDVPLGSAEQLDIRPNANVSNPPSNVQRLRAMEAGAIAAAYAQKPELIAIKGGAEQMAQRSGGAGGGVDDLLAGPIAIDADEFDLVEQYPAIERLRIQRALMNNANAEKIRANWARELQELRNLASQPNLTPQQRLFLKRVAERYMQLMNEVD